MQILPLVERWGALLLTPIQLADVTKEVGLPAFLLRVCVPSCKESEGK